MRAGDRAFGGIQECNLLSLNVEGRSSIRRANQKQLRLVWHLPVAMEHSNYLELRAEMRRPSSWRRVKADNHSGSKQPVPITLNSSFFGPGLRPFWQVLAHVPDGWWFRRAPWDAGHPNRSLWGRDLRIYIDKIVYGLNDRRL